MKNFPEKSLEERASRQKDRKCNRTRQKNKRGDIKVESNDSPEIPDRGETSDIPGLPSGGNTRTLRAARKLKELTHEMDRHRWNILGLCEMRWKNFGETTTVEGHQVFFSGKENKHEHGVGFLVHKDIVNTVMGRHSSS